VVVTPLSKSSELPLLVFDGDCAFCTTWVNRLEAVLPRFPKTIPWQWADLDALGLSQDDVNHYVWYLTSSHHFGGHMALSALLRSQPLIGLRFVGNLIATPPFSIAAAVGYHFVAKYRHLLPGGTPACQVEPEDRVLRGDHIQPGE
jgi:predicted DCC family thiol-disulfide oxidoreductase YuxK